MYVSARIGACLVVYVVLLKYTPLGEIGMSGAFALAIAFLMVIGGLFALQPKWRTELATHFGWVLAGFAWLTAIVYDTSTPALTTDSNSMLFGVAICALVYAIAIKPLADEERRLRDEQSLRRAIRSEIHGLYRLPD